MTVGDDGKVELRRVWGVLTVGLAEKFSNAFPVLAKKGLATDIYIFWNTGLIAPGESVEIFCVVPEGYVGVMEWLSWDLSEYYVADVELTVDGKLTWQEKNTTSFTLKWSWIRAGAHKWCRTRVTNNGTTNIRAIWRGQSFLLKAHEYNKLVDMVLKAYSMMMGEEDEDMVRHFEVIK